ncbi:MAG TPA: lamin tail domain-containing protein, partial [Myxococcota bacterium]|nr:lamin tail domain-containing protein [Myxococcota bacterium]
PGAAYNESSTSCMEDRDGDGYGDDDAPSGVTDGTDCNDDDADVNPGESEIIANEVDDNCDGTEVCYADVDEDGYGDSSSYENSTSDEDCDDAGEATSTTDCDDSDEYTHPNAASKDGAACMTDADEDNWGSETAPSGGSAGTDCDDDDEDVNPDGTETVGNDVDEDCDDEAECYYDADEDGDGTEFGTTYNNGDEDCNDTNEASTKTDCDDTDDTRAGTNSETTSNDIDDDCDDVIDEGSYSGGEVVISEIHNDPKYSDGGEEFDGEWFELYNTSASDDYYLGGWQIDLGPGSGSRFYVGIDSNLMVASQSYVVLCYDDVTLGSKCDYVYGSTQSWESDKGATYNGNAKLANNYADDGDTVALTVGSTTIDSVKYTTGNYFSEPTSGNSIELGDDYLDDNDNDVGSYWCESDDTDTGFMYYDGTATNDEYGTPQTSASCTPTP